MQWICSAMASCSRRCHRCLNKWTPQASVSPANMRKYGEKTWQHHHKFKYAPWQWTIGTIPTIYRWFSHWNKQFLGDFQFAMFDDRMNPVNWTWILGSNKIQREVLQEGHGDVPKVGDRVGATAKFQAGRLPWWTDSAAWFVDDPMEKWVMTTPVTKPLPCGKILPVCPNDYGSFNGVDDEKHWQTTKFRV